MQISHVFQSLDIIIVFTEFCGLYTVSLIKLSDIEMAAAKWQKGRIFIIWRNRSSFDS